MIYLDHASTTPVRSEVLDCMLQYFSYRFGNPSSLHQKGREAYQAVEEARASVARDLNCFPDELIFTSGGTESNNLAIRGSVLNSRASSVHILTTAIEHPSILHTCRQLQQRFGVKLTCLPVDSEGMVSPDDFRRAITPNTILASVMYANNEVGTLEPVTELAQIAQERGILFHTDAVQVLPSTKLDLRALGVDLLSISAHKCYGPKGVGVLFVRRGLQLFQTQTGGRQEKTRRAGTENVPGVVGAAAAIRFVTANQHAHQPHLAALRDRLVHGLLNQVPGARLTGHPSRRLANSASFVFPGIPGPEELLLMLDLKGVEASSGSACSSKAVQPSHVLSAMGIAPSLASGSLRLSLGYENTEAEIDRAIRIISEVVIELQGVAGSFLSTQNLTENP